MCCFPKYDKLSKKSFDAFNTNHSFQNEQDFIQKKCESWQNYDIWLFFKMLW